MDRIGSSGRGGRLHRWLAAGLSAGLPVLGLGCLTPPRVAPNQPNQPPPLTRLDAEPGPIRPVQHTVNAAATAVPAAPQQLPITLDSVFHLAERQNARIGQARERLNESLLTQAQKSRLWLPNVYAGVGYFRHEGGIQDQDGRLIHSSTGALAPGLTIQSEIDLREATFQEIDAQRKVWQEKGSLAQVNNEVLLDAALTYVDLLTARRGEAVARDLEAYEKKLLDRAVKLAETDRSATGLVEGIRASLSNRHQILSQLRQQGNAASTKLVYLLGLPPETVLVPVDPVLAPIDLVDLSPGPSGLVAQAMAQGPGVQELQGILGVIQTGLDMSHGIHNLLPALQVNAYEGAYGAGPGGSLSFDNRLDVNLQLRWNLTQLCQADYQRTVARSKQTQAMLSYDDLRGKLAAGVLEAAEAIMAGREQIGHSAEGIQRASESYRRSDERLQEGLREASPGEVVTAIRALEQAHFNRLSAISAHNKAQIRLLLYLGGACAGPAAPPAPRPAAPGAPSPKPTQLPMPLPMSATSSPVPGGPDGSLIQVYPR